MSNKKRNSIIGAIVTIVIISIAAYIYIHDLLSTSFNIDKPVYIYIDKNTDYNSILTQLDTTAHIENISKFKQLAQFKKYPDNIKTGRYEIRPNMNINSVIENLKMGKQKAVKLTFNNIRLKEDLAKRISQQLNLSEKEILNTLNDSIVCNKLGFKPETVIAMFIPNTYEVYWDTSIEAFLTKMDSEYNKFWNNNRKQKAEQLGLNPIEVATLASIVEEECFYQDEYPIVAGLYLNRLNRGQLLQADPTVKFAVGDFSLRRILFKHLEINSPYNTYQNLGLPPGPIRMPSIKAIDSVLSPAQHEYYYMCAKEDLSRRHNFAKTHIEHERNAAKYRNALNKSKIFN